MVPTKGHKPNEISVYILCYMVYPKCYYSTIKLTTLLIEKKVFLLIILLQITSYIICGHSGSNMIS